MQTMLPLNTLAAFQIFHRFLLVTLLSPVALSNPPKVDFENQMLKTIKSSPY